MGDMYIWHCANMGVRGKFQVSVLIYYEPEPFVVVVVVCNYSLGASGDSIVSDSHLVNH